ncbi:MAG: hypothetical protein J6M62_03660 [Selenomonadaceae bacterium]|nr:hypothetical protein [Selenomonadaceae bacterium]MBO6304163.1 hypothetical protein [Selenomonadaceae bacterium]
MAVLARFRRESKYKFYTNALKLRKEITQLMLRDFGAKKTIRNYRINTDKMEPQDADLLLGIMERYGLSTFPGDFPLWLIEKFRDSVWDILRDLHINITKAYTIWATNEAEANERRIYQDRAIAACENLLQEFQLVIDVLPVKAEKYMRYVDMVEEEISLLKGWRKADNKKNKTLKESKTSKEE